MSEKVKLNLDTAFKNTDEAFAAMDRAFNSAFKTKLQPPVPGRQIIRFQAADRRMRLKLFRIFLHLATSMLFKGKATLVAKRA